MSLSLESIEGLRAKLRDDIGAPMDEPDLLRNTTIALLTELHGVTRAMAKWNRRAERRSRHIIGLIDSADRKQAEIKRLEEVLAWVYRTEQPLEEIRAVIARTVPRRIRKDTPRMEEASG